MSPSELPNSAPWRSVVWTRGSGCAELASLLSIGDPVRVDDDLRSTCIAERARLVVARKLTSFDLVSTAVPIDLKPGSVGGVVAAVGPGPNSALAALVADRLADALGVSGSVVSASPHPEQDEGVEITLREISSLVPDLPSKVVRASSARNLVATLPADTLLVIGAPGGSWLQRQFFGPGRKLIVGSPGGVVVVRSAPRRCFQEMLEPAALGSGLRVAEARRLLQGDAAPVVTDGMLVGVIRRAALVDAFPEDTIGSIAEDAVFVSEEDPVEAAEEVGAFIRPVPVVDGGGRLTGVMP
ncbi:MAG TPA: CBS domain-containing protein [Acidimicrobiia bacterium]|nr:CBS domain-containing protein [Acidimicrobiia bacterium]